MHVWRILNGWLLDKIPVSSEADTILQSYERLSICFNKHDLRHLPNQKCFLKQYICWLVFLLAEVFLPSTSKIKMKYQELSNTFFTQSCQKG